MRYLILFRQFHYISFDYLVWVLFFYVAGVEMRLEAEEASSGDPALISYSDFCLQPGDNNTIAIKLTCAGTFYNWQLWKEQKAKALNHIPQRKQYYCNHINPRNSLSTWLGSWSLLSFGMLSNLSLWCYHAYHLWYHPQGLVVNYEKTESLFYNFYYF